MKSLRCILGTNILSTIAKLKNKDNWRGFCQDVGVRTTRNLSPHLDNNHISGNLSDKTFLKGLQLVEAGLDGKLEVILVHFSSKFSAATSPSSPMKGSMNVLLKQPSHSF